MALIAHQGQILGNGQAYKGEAGQILGFTEKDKVGAVQSVPVVKDGSTVFPTGKSIQFGIDSNGNYGYIKDGADTVTPFKNPTGDKTITANGTHDVEDYKNAVVSVPNSNTKTYTPTSRSASLDMGATNDYRYVNTNSVPNSNSGTYTANSRSSSLDMGATNSYRYVNTNGVPNSNSGTFTPTESSYYGFSALADMDMGYNNSYRYVNLMQLIRSMFVDHYVEDTSGSTGYGGKGVNLIITYGRNQNPVGVSGTASILLHEVKNVSGSYYITLDVVSYGIPNGGSWDIQISSTNVNARLWCVLFNEIELTEEEVVEEG